jgi:uncharacterized damage-inducible protein DinB
MPMTTPSERRDMIAKIRKVADQLEQAIQGLNDEQLDTPYGEGKWTPRQVVHHLADSHLHGFIRFKAILTEDHPTLKVYDQDDWANTPDANMAPPASSIAIVRGLHERWCFLMEHLSEGEWERKGFHPERGEVSLDNLLKIYVNHGANHAGQILGLRRARGW